MASIKDFRDSLIWQKAIALGELVYRVTAQFPKQEMFGLTSQVRRAACSVSSNIAEGHARRDGSFGHFVSIAVGSAAELQSQMLLAGALRYVSAGDVERISDLAQQIRRMGYSLIDKVGAR